MSSASHDRRANIVIFAALVAPLLLVVSIYAHARRAEREREAAVDGALRDYAAIAAWQLSRRLGDSLHQLATGILHSAGLQRGEMGMSGMAGMRNQCARCLDSALVARSFRVDLSSGKTISTGSSLAATALPAIVDALRDSTFHSGTEPHRTAFVTVDGAPHLIAAFVERGADVAAGVVIGFDTFTALMNGTLLHGELLPASLVKPPYGADRLYVRLSKSDGATIYESGAPNAPHMSATDTMPRAWGGAAVTVELMPTLADALLLRGSTSNPWQFLLLIGASALLVAGALFQIRRARALDRSRTQFVANVSHELRTPLAHISMFAETIMLERERSPGERRHFASVIHREAGRLATLVESVLRFSRGAENGTALQVESRSVAPDVNEIVEAFAPLAQEASSKISVDVAPTLRAMTNQAAFRQIVLNLLDNAVKYGPEDQTIRISGSRRNGDVVLVVEDEGDGIPVADRTRVLEPFVRLERHARVTGTGIGLSVVRDLAVAHGGRVWIEEREGRGTRVCVALRPGDEST